MQKYLAGYLQKITNCNLQNALGYLQKGKLNNSHGAKRNRRPLDHQEYVIFGFTFLTR